MFSSMFRMTLLSSLVLLAACAAPVAENTAASSANAQKLDCSEQEALTGSRIPKRGTCVPRTEESIAAARQQAEAMRQSDMVAREATRTASAGR